MNWKKNKVRHRNSLRTISRPVITLAAGMVIFVCSWGQEPGRVQNGKARDPQSGIQDNSFLIEEAYNQEEGVVQHISNLSYVAAPQRNLVYVFTQEWPLKGQTHQFSYTIPYGSYDGNRMRGIGDALLNYRYQLFEDGDWAYVAPRLSVILPTGDESKGLGNGVVGVQLSVPASKELSPSFVIHGNLGSTILGKSKTLISFYAGGSVIWQFKNNIHFMLENLVFSNASTDASGDVVRETEVVVNPALRFALNFENLQIVPGVGVPISLKNGEKNTSLFVYLSFEHPF